MYGLGARVCTFLGRRTILQSAPGRGACHDHWICLVWASAATVKSDKEEGLASLGELVVLRLGHPKIRRTSRRVRWHV